MGDDVIAVHWFGGAWDRGVIVCHASPDNILEYKGSPLFTHLERCLWNEIFTG